MTISNIKFHFIIIGQGLAGSLLAWRLIEQGKKVLVIDACLQQTTSRSAAGLINPVTGKRLVKPDNIANYLAEAKKLYTELSFSFGEKFLFEKQQLKLFQTEDDVLQWQKRRKDEAYAAYLGEQFQGIEKSFLKAGSLGGFEQKQCGYLDTVSLLDKLRCFLLEKNSFVKAELNLNDLKIRRDSVEWKCYQAEKAVFCDGYHLQNNPWFSWLPLQPVQGEIITLETDQTLPEEIIQFGKWLLPLTKNQFKLGATWQWQPLDEMATEKSFNELTKACYAEFPQLKGAKVIEKKVGIRPATKDKNPFIGQHPELPQLMVFNGFGSKGSLLIPWYSECFAQYLLKGEGLPNHVDIKRYKNVYTAR